MRSGRECGMVFIANEYKLVTLSDRCVAIHWLAEERLVARLVYELWNLCQKSREKCGYMSILVLYFP